jgi:hypothetical protein
MFNIRRGMKAVEKVFLCIKRRFLLSPPQDTVRTGRLQLIFTAGKCRRGLNAGIIILKLRLNQHSGKLSLPTEGRDSFYLRRGEVLYVSNCSDPGACAMMFQEDGLEKRRTIR